MRLVENGNILRGSIFGNNGDDLLTVYPALHHCKVGEAIELCNALARSMGNER